jgi:hypothetical protein
MRAVSIFRDERSLSFFSAAASDDVRSLRDAASESVCTQSGRSLPTSPACFRWPYLRLEHKVQLLHEGRLPQLYRQAFPAVRGRFQRQRWQEEEEGLEGRGQQGWQDWSRRSRSRRAVAAGLRPLRLGVCLIDARHAPDRCGWDAGQVLVIERQVGFVRMNRMFAGQEYAGGPCSATWGREVTFHG